MSTHLPILLVIQHLVRIVDEPKLFLRCLFVDRAHVLRQPVGVRLKSHSPVSLPHFAPVLATRNAYCVRDEIYLPLESHLS